MSTRFSGSPRTAVEPAEAGFATIVVLGLAGALLAFGALLACLGAVAVARHRAAAAADLAALAAAGHLLEGTARACSVAAAVARGQAATLLSCVSDGTTVTIVAEVRPPGSLGQLGAARSTARAARAASVGAGTVIR